MSQQASAWFEDVIDRGADLVIDELRLGERDTDLTDIVRAAIRTSMTRPDASLNDAISEHMSDSPEQVRSWWFGWT